MEPVNYDLVTGAWMFDSKLNLLLNKKGRRRAQHQRQSHGGKRRRKKKTELGMGLERLRDGEDVSENPRLSFGLTNDPVTEETRLLDVASIKSLFPQAAHEPIVMNRTSPRRVEDMKIETINSISMNPVLSKATSKIVTTHKQRSKKKATKSTSRRLKKSYSKNKNKPQRNSLTQPFEEVSSDSNAVREEKEREREALATSVGLTMEQIEKLEKLEDQMEEDSAVYMKAFKEFDKDGSGDISPEELRQVLQSLDAELPPGEIDKIIEEADKDGDGTIDYEEFSNMMKARKRILTLAGSLSNSSTKQQRTHRMPENQSDASVQDIQRFNGVISLAPLKLQKSTISKSNAKGRRIRLNMNPLLSRKTPSVLALGNKATAKDLKRELNRVEGIVKQLNDKVQEDVQWVQENCPVTSLRAQLYCKRWGMQKLQNVMKRLEYKEVIAAWSIWSDFVVNRRNEEQVEKYMKLKGSRRLTALFANWKRKKTIAAWNSWINIVEHQQTLELDAAARQLQRSVRGYLGRIHAWAIKQKFHAVQIERVVRGFLGRQKVKAIKEHKELVKAAISVQRAYRGYAGKKLAKMILKTHFEKRSATSIQRVWRGMRGRVLAEEKRTFKFRTEQAINIERVWRGYVDRQLICWIQQAVAENLACLRIQTCFRGYSGRMRGIELMETRMQLIAEDEACLKIQTIYRCYAAKLAVDARRRLVAAVSIQSQWRARKTFQGYQIMRAEIAMREKQKLVAATRIQSVYRGFCARNLLAQLKYQRDETNAARKIQRLRRGQIGRRQYLTKREAYDQKVRSELRRRRESKAASAIQTRYRSYKQHKAYTLFKQQKMHDMSSRQIQKTYRGYIGRRSFKNHKQRNITVTKLQARFRGARDRKELKKIQVLKSMSSKQREIEAAIKIQSRVRTKLARKKSRNLHQSKALKALEVLRQEEKKKEELEKEAASIKIQNSIRIHKSAKVVEKRRKELKLLEEAEVKRQQVEAETASAILIQSRYRGVIGKRYVVKARSALDQNLATVADARAKKEMNDIYVRDVAASKIQTVFRIYEDRKRLTRLKDQATVERQNHLEAVERMKKEQSALRIQAQFRAKRDKARVHKMKLDLYLEMEKKQKEIRRKAEEEKLRKDEERLATLKMQTMIRGRNARKKAEEKRTIAMMERMKQSAKEEVRRQEATVEDAVLKIQCAYRTRQAQRAMQERFRAHQQKLEEMKRQGIEAEELRRMEEEQEQEMAASKMQNIYRQRVARLQLSAKREKRKKEVELEKQRSEEKMRSLAASRIQAVFRGKRERRLYELKVKEVEEERLQLEHGTLYGEEADSPEENAMEDVGEWVEYWDENSQAYYYFNTVTQEARWDDPRKQADQGYNSAGTGTDYETDTYNLNTGEYYQGYYDDQGNWIEGGYYDYADPASSEAYGQTEQNATEFGTNDETEPSYAEAEQTSEWEEYYDDSYQQSYFYNVYTQQTSWEQPPGFISKYDDPASQAPRYG